MHPPDHVLDLFAVPGDVHALPGGRGRSIRAGDLVLSQGHDEILQGWLSPVLARFAARLDEDPRRVRQDLRVAMPVPARDGSWVVDGWAAARYEPGTSVCQDLEVSRASGRLLHARLAVLLPTAPPALAARTGPLALAERAAFKEVPVGATAADPGVRGLAELALKAVDREGDGPRAAASLVHTRLHGNVLLDAGGAPVVVDVAPAWRPPLWADALCVLDAVVADDEGALGGALLPFSVGPARAAMLRAIAYRLLAEPAGRGVRYAGALDRLGV